VEKTLKENKVELFSKDRFQPSGWLVIDAIDFVVHIFSQEQRDNYAIEQLWKDADEILFEDL
jgi:ribosome-associated protein